MTASSNKGSDPLVDAFWYKEGGPEEIQKEIGRRCPEMFMPTQEWEALSTVQKADRAEKLAERLQEDKELARMVAGLILHANIQQGMVNQIAQKGPPASIGHDPFSFHSDSALDEQYVPAIIRGVKEDGAKWRRKHLAEGYGKAAEAAFEKK